MNRNKVYKGDKRWHLILVNDHGSVIPLGTVKILLFGLVAALVVTSVCAIIAGGLYLRQKLEFSTINKELDQKEEQLQLLRDKRDMLMTQLVITESKLNSGKNANAIAGGKPSSEPAELEPDAAAGETVKEEQDTGLQGTAATDDDPDPVSVVISNFNIVHHPKSKEITASYRLENTTPGNQRIGGKSVLLLKGTINGEATTYPIPNVPWENAMPSFRHGRPFFIRNFMTLGFNRSAPGGSFIFDRVIVYVFEAKGNVLLKKEIPIDLSYGENNVPSKAQTSVKNSKDSETEADMKGNTPVGNEP